MISMAVCNWLLQFSYKLYRDTTNVREKKKHEISSCCHKHSEVIIAMIITTISYITSTFLYNFSTPPLSLSFYISKQAWLKRLKMISYVTRWWVWLLLLLQRASFFFSIVVHEQKHVTLFEYQKGTEKMTWQHLTWCHHFIFLPLNTIWVFKKIYVNIRNMCVVHHQRHKMFLLTIYPFKYFSKRRLLLLNIIFYVFKSCLEGTILWRIDVNVGFIVSLYSFSTTAHQQLWWLCKKISFKWHSWILLNLSFILLSLCVFFLTKNVLNII